MSIYTLSHFNNHKHYAKIRKLNPHIEIQCKGCNKTLKVQFRKSKTREWCSKRCANTNNVHRNSDRGFYRYLERKWNIYKEEYDKMVSKGCGICGEQETRKIKGNTIKMPLDHDHKTGKPRGVLCSHCNQGLGMFKDNTDRLQKAIDYLNSNR